MSSLIALEGIDGCGKSTIARGLETAMRNILTSPVRMVSFPTDGTVTGGMIQDVLYGWKPDCQSTWAKGILFALDRLWNFPWDWYRSQGNCVAIVDRYVPSNLIYQGATYDGTDRANVVSWLRDLEYDRLKLPEPDLVLYLDLPPEESRKRLEERAESTGVELDQNEGELDYQKRCYELGMEMAKAQWWKVIPCKDRTPREILIDCIQAIVGLLLEDDDIPFLIEESDLPWS